MNWIKPSVLLDRLSGDENMDWILINATAGCIYIAKLALVSSPPIE
jgi:hypothetical protein